MSSRWKPVKINLIERPEWSEYDTAGKLGTYIQDQVWEELQHSNSSDIAEHALEVIGNAFVAVREAARDHDDELKEALIKSDPRLDTFRQLVQDALSYAWEEELVPKKTRIDAAMEDTVSYFEEKWREWIGSHDRLWEIFEFSGKPKDLMMNLMDSYVSFEQKEGWADRYLIFKPEGPYRLLTKAAILPEKRGVMEWTPPLEIPREEIAQELGSLYQEIQEPFIGRLFDNIRDAMDIDPSPNFEKQWKNLLKTDPKTVALAKDEILEFLKDLEK